MVAQLSGSPPPTPPQSPHVRAETAALPDVPSPQPLASFSFTQLFAALDEAAAAAEVADATALADPSALSTGLTAVPPTMAPPPLSEVPAMTFHDCVLLKLSLTCALCGRLLRDNPAAVETCGHCFCYDCINTALEDGCPPLAMVWPWSTLSEEVGAAEERLTASTTAHVTAEDADVVHLSSSSAPRTTASLPPQRWRKSRKVRQLCPLCLGPAFKWMLVSLPSLAELCAALHVAYPELEETLMRLTATAPGGPAGGEQSTSQSTHTHAHASCDAADLVVAAFAPRTAPSDGDECDEEAEDEEAERRRRRSSGGPRKGITFAADLENRAPPASTTTATAATATRVHAVECEEGRDAEDAEDPAGQRQPNGGLLCPTDAQDLAVGATLAESLQLSADLIPSPVAPALAAPTPPAPPSPPRRAHAPSGWQSYGADSSGVDAAPLCREDVLGHTPPMGGGSDDVGADDDDDDPIAEARNAGVPASALDAGPHQRRLRLLVDTATTVETDGSGGGAPRSCLLDRARTLLRAHCPSATEWTLVWDGPPECGEEDSSVAMATSAQRHRYSSVRLGSADDAAQHCRLGDAGAMDGADAAPGSVHAQDVWTLNTAWVRRHPRLPSCFAVLRHGHVLWEGDEEDSRESSSTEATGSAAPPILCVVGDYPRPPREHEPAAASARRSYLPRLTPTACTALLLGVPCMDTAWQRGGGGSGGSGDAPLSFERCHALYGDLERLAAAAHGAASPPLPLPIAPAPVSWMSAARRAPGSDVSRGTDATAASPPFRDTYMFFLLPDGAVCELAEMLYRVWAHVEVGDQSPVDQDDITTSQQPLAPLSRKRTRDVTDRASEVHSCGDWATTDRHPQRAWRRLLLVAGAAAVEVSGALFKALVANATCLSGSGDGGATAMTCAEESPAPPPRQRRLRSRRDEGGAWIHVDVAGSLGDAWMPVAPTEVAANASAGHKALQLLYSPAVARDTFVRLADSEGGGGSAAAAHSRACLRRFRVFLDGLAAQIALAAAPVLPGGASRRHEARPASWLLETIAEGRESAGSSESASQSSSLSAPSDAPGTSSAARITTADTHTAAPVTGEFSPSDDSLPVAYATVHTIQSQYPGVYRSLLYADTP
ncbi:RING finger protein [Novymonas esmeraldas]|uniref:RING finger protein n=1 Tax=Novymonas esmeraldas TaxID=1808958 RepID=A0AAW0EKV0_9TRYP